jgi:hypothetical protein
MALPLVLLALDWCESQGPVERALEGGGGSAIVMPCPGWGVTTRITGAVSAIPAGLVRNAGEGSARQREALHHAEKRTLGTGDHEYLVGDTSFPLKITGVGRADIIICCAWRESRRSDAWYALLDEVRPTHHPHEVVQTMVLFGEGRLKIGHFDRPTRQASRMQELLRDNRRTQLRTIVSAPRSCWHAAGRSIRADTDVAPYNAKSLSRGCYAALPTASSAIRA